MSHSAGSQSDVLDALGITEYQLRAPVSDLSQSVGVVLQISDTEQHQFSVFIDSLKMSIECLLGADACRIVGNDTMPPIHHARLSVGDQSTNVGSIDQQFAHSLSDICVSEDLQRQLLRALLLVSEVKEHY